MGEPNQDNGKYQKTQRKKHPARKKRLLTKGGQKNDVAGSPYKIKINPNRSKSAPPMGEGADE